MYRRKCIYFSVKYIHSRRKNICSCLNVLYFTSEENLFTCEEKCKFSCLDVHVFTSEKKFLFTREEKKLCSYIS